MKLLFMGTPHFSIPFLEAVLREHEVLGVVTQPDKPRGRGLKVKPSPVKEFALARGLKVLTPAKLDDDFKRDIEILSPEVVVVAAYGRFLPDWLLEFPPKGCLNVHPSLLPKFRGPAPIQRAIMAGEKETGVSIIKLVPEMDAGDVYAVRKVPIDDTDNVGSLERKLATAGADLLLEVLRGIESGSIKPLSQDHSKATYAPKIQKEEMLIDWKKSAVEIRNLVRALSPSPGARSFYKGRVIKILEAEVADLNGTPGTVLLAHPKRGLIVAAGNESLKIETLKPEGKKEMKGEEFVRGYRVQEGDIFTSQKAGC